MGDYDHKYLLVTAWERLNELPKIIMVVGAHDERLGTISSVKEDDVDLFSVSVNNVCLVY